MAIYHNTVNSICPRQGRSIVASSSYITGEKRVEERTGEIHDYTRKRGVVYHEVLLCQNAPKEYINPSILWNEVARIEGAVGRTGKSIEMALPRELSSEEQKRFAREAVKDFFVRSGRCVEYAIHDKGDGNPHIHVIATTRPIDKNGKWEYKREKVYICKNRDGDIKELSARELKTIDNSFEKQLPYFKNGNLNNCVFLTKYEQENNDKWKKYKRVKGKNDPKKTKKDRENLTCVKWNSKQNINEWRAFWCDRINYELEQKNLPQRVSHKSYEAQGIDKIPTKHLGKSAKQMEQRGIKSKREMLNREIIQLNLNIRNTQSEFNVIKRLIEQDNKWNQFHEAISGLQRDAIEHRTDETYQQSTIEKLMVLEEKVNTYLREPNYHKNDYYNIDDNMISYRRYHTEKIRDNIAFTRILIKSSLVEINQNLKNQAPTDSVIRAARRQTEKLNVQHIEQLEQGKPHEEYSQIKAQAIVEGKGGIDFITVAHRLERYRSEYIKAIIHANVTVYKENPIYKQQSNQIKDCVRIIKEHNESIEKLKITRDKLNIFQGRDKKELKRKIENFEMLRAMQYDKLKALGVSDPLCVNKVIREKILLAEKEKAKANNEYESKDATRASRIKKAFRSLAQTVPEKDCMAVLEEMKKVRIQNNKDIDTLKSEMTAQRELDTAFKLKRMKEKGRTNTHELSRCNYR